MVPLFILQEFPPEGEGKSPAAKFRQKKRTV
jgi:hypothetical protein